jgi:hypothetical protein
MAKGRPKGAIVLTDPPVALYSTSCGSTTSNLT